MTTGRAFASRASTLGTSYLDTVSNISVLYCTAKKLSHGVFEVLQKLPSSGFLPTFVFPGIKATRPFINYTLQAPIMRNDCEHIIVRVELFILPDCIS